MSADGRPVTGTRDSSGSPDGRTCSGPAAPVTVYVSIANSDDKLTQAEWSDFVLQVSTEVVSYASTVHGAWFSLPTVRWQNACWCLEFTSEAAMQTAREHLAILRKSYRQDSAAWAVAETEFV